MDERIVSCITCQHNLLDTGKFAKDPHFVYCSVCYAYYQVVPITDEYGRVQQTFNGDSAFYLNPVKPGNAAHLKPSIPQDQKPNFSSLLEKIQNAKTPQDLTD